MLEGLLGQLRNHVDIDNLAAKIGMTPAQVEQAVGSLTKGHVDSRDTVEVAAEDSGLPQDKLREVMEHVGGEGALTRFSQMLGGSEGGLGGITKMLDRDGDGNIMDDVAGLAGGLFGKK